MAQWIIFSMCRIILTAAADVTGKDEEIQEATADEKTEERKEKKKQKSIRGINDTEERKRQAGSIYDSNAISPTLTTMFPGGDKQPFVLVNEGTKKGT